jgi:hypothetical protein
MLAPEPQERAGPTADIEETTPSDTEQALETGDLAGVVPLVASVSGRLFWSMVASAVDGGCHLIEHRSRTVEL